MITPDDHVGKTRDMLITVDELYHVFSALTDHYEKLPPTPFHDTARAYTKDLAFRFIGVWNYWSTRTNDTSRFTLTIKK